MKVLLIKDVYKLGLAGEVKKVASGYGRNYLIPQGLAVLATPGALKTASRISEAAKARRVLLNQEMSGAAELLQGIMVNFPARAGETGKLYGSITSRMIADALKVETGVEVNSRQVDSQPIRSLGLHTVDIRLTMDLVPQIQVLVYREGESPATALEAIAAAEAAEEAELEAGMEADEAVEEIEAEEAGEASEPDAESEPADELLDVESGMADETDEDLLSDEGESIGEPEDD